MAKVINKTITTHLTNMKDGDVAEIVNWFCDEEWSLELQFRGTEML